MIKYFKYLKYIIEHKKNVFKVCIKRKMFLHAILHDLSKFTITEFVSYAKCFYGSEEDKRDSGFEYGWLHHQRRNKHHWEYWVQGNGAAVKIPEKYILQMVCDWEAMSLKFEDSPIEFYKKK